MVIEVSHLSLAADYAFLSQAGKVGRDQSQYDRFHYIAHQPLPIPGPVCEMPDQVNSKDDHKGGQAVRDGTCKLGTFGESEIAGYYTSNEGHGSRPSSSPIIFLN